VTSKTPRGSRLIRRGKVASIRTIGRGAPWPCR
jgi:hypothetical protein